MPGFIYISTTLTEKSTQSSAQPHRENTAVTGVVRKVEAPKCEKQDWNHGTEILKIGKMETNADKKRERKQKV